MAEEYHDFLSEDLLKGLPVRGLVGRTKPTEEELSYFAMPVLSMVSRLREDDEEVMFLVMANDGSLHLSWLVTSHCVEQCVHALLEVVGPVGLLVLSDENHRATGIFTRCHLCGGDIILSEADVHSSGWGGYAYCPECWKFFDKT